MFAAAFCSSQLCSVPAQPSTPRHSEAGPWLPSAPARPGLYPPSLQHQGWVPPLALRVTQDALPLPLTPRPAPLVPLCWHSPSLDELKSTSKQNPRGPACFSGSRWVPVELATSPAGGPQAQAAVAAGCPAEGPSRVDGPHFPHQCWGGLSKGAPGPAAGVRAGRTAGCWETSLLSSDKNSSIFEARGLAALPAMQGMCLHPPGCGGRGRMSCGVCASDPHPTRLL